MVGFHSVPLDPGAIRLQQVNGYNHHKEQARLAEHSNNKFVIYIHHRHANQYARELNDPKFPVFNLENSFGQLKTAAEKLQAACLDYTGYRNTELETKIKSCLSASIEEAYRDQQGFSVALQPEIKARDKSALSALKAVLLNEIKTYQGAKQEQALWAALIPGSVVREIFHVSTDSIPGRGTSMTRGTFKQVVDALVRLQNGKRNDDPLCVNNNVKAIDASVVAALRSFKSRDAQGFNKFIGKLQTHEHARVLYDALPPELARVFFQPPGNGVTAVNSRQSVTGKTVSTTKVDQNVARFGNSAFTY